MESLSLKGRTARALRAILLLTLVVALFPLIITSIIIIYLHFKYRFLEPAVELPRQVTGRLGVKTMSEVMELLKAIPFETRLTRALATVALTLPDLVPTLLDTNRLTTGIVYPYPEVFEPVILESQDGTPVCGLLAMQPDGRKGPALVVVHGLFGTKNKATIQSLATTAFYRWGFHVLVIDLRNFGDSSRFSEAPTSFGYRESDDILAAARYLGSIEKVSTVGACGISMGAASTLLAAARSRADDPLTGGAVAVNGYGEVEKVLEHISRPQRLTAEYIAIWLVFRILLVAKTLLEGPRPMADLRTYLSEVSSQYYEMSDQELYRKASPLRVVSKIEVPCLIIHALDDNIIPVTEARELLAAAVDNPMVDALVVPSGGHALYPAVSPDWYYSVLRTFFTYWAEFEGNVTGQYGIDSVNTSGNQDN